MIRQRGLDSHKGWNFPALHSFISFSIFDVPLQHFCFISEVVSSGFGLADSCRVPNFVGNYFADNCVVCLSTVAVLDHGWRKGHELDSRAIWRDAAGLHFYIFFVISLNP